MLSLHPCMISGRYLLPFDRKRKGLQKKRKKKKRRKERVRGRVRGGGGGGREKTRQERDEQKGKVLSSFWKMSRKGKYCLPFGRGAERESTFFLLENEQKGKGKLLSSFWKRSRKGIKELSAFWEMSRKGKYCLPFGR